MACCRQVERRDSGCLLVSGAAHLPVTVDSWGLLGGVSPAVEAAERGFAATVVDVTVQSRFAAAKGSTPVRLDARDASDNCSQKAVAALDRPGFAVSTPHLTANPDWLTAIWRVANDYWLDPAMAPEAAVAVPKAQAKSDWFVPRC